jgi:multiple sugar transport system substrate-binding protein
MKTTRVSRRRFLHISAIAAGGAVLAACGGSSQPAQPGQGAAQPTSGAAAQPTAAVGQPAAGSATTAPAAAKPATIAWWTVPSEEWSEEAQRKMLDAFEQANPNIKVDLTVLPADGYDEKMTTALGANQGAPDVALFWNSAWLPQALDLEPLIKAENFDKSQYVKGFWDTRTQFKGTTVGLPLGVGANFVMYNKSIYDEMGVAYPDVNLTPEQWLELTPKLTDPAKKRWGGDRPRGPFRAIWFNMGARPFSEDSKTVNGYLNGEASVKAYTWLWDLVNSNSTPTPADLDVLGTAGTGPVDLFIAGRLATATLNQGHMFNATEAGVPFGIAREPGPASGERWVNAWSNTISVWSGTKEPEAAWTFLRFWGGPEGQKLLMENGNLIPSIQSLQQQFPKANEEYAKNFFQLLQDRQVAEVGTLPWTAPVLRAALPVWDKVMTNQIKRDQIKAELDAVVPEAQKALDDARARLG